MFKTKRSMPTHQHVSLSIVVVEAWRTLKFKSDLSCTYRKCLNASVVPESSEYTCLHNPTYSLLGQI